MISNRVSRTVESSRLRCSRHFTGLRTEKRARCLNGFLSDLSVFISSAGDAGISTRHTAAEISFGVLSPVNNLLGKSEKDLWRDSFLLFLYSFYGISCCFIGFQMGTQRLFFCPGLFLEIFLLVSLIQGCASPMALHQVF